MATVTPKPLIDGALLANVVGTLYLVPAATTAVCRSLTLCNTDSADRTVTLYVVPSGGSPDAARTIMNGLTIKAGQTLVDDTLRALLAAGSIQGFADVANKVSIRADGSEVT
jgi:hypothetical protein